MRIRKLLCCLLLVTVLAGCTGQNENIDTTEATEESTLPQETTAPTEPEEITLEARSIPWPTRLLPSVLKFPCWTNVLPPF